MSKKNGTTEANQPFYTDQAKLAHETRDQSRTIDKIRKAKITYETVTKDTVETIEQLKEMVSDPTAYFVRLKTLHAQAQTEKIKGIFGEGLDVSSFIKNSLPETFIEVINACRLCESVKWSNYTFNEGRIELSQEFHTRLIGTVYFFAVTSLQKARLSFAEKMKAMVESEMHQLLMDEARENNKTEDIRRPAAMKDFIGGLPYCLRLEWRNEPGKIHIESRSVQINHHWVVDGFSQWVPDVLPKPKERKPNYNKYRLAQRAMMDGAMNVFYFAQGMNVPLDPLRQTKTTLLPNYYHIINGHFVDTGEKAPRYPDHPLYVQPDKGPGNKVNTGPRNYSLEPLIEIVD
jgi:hypothetical protein